MAHEYDTDEGEAEDPGQSAADIAKGPKLPVSERDYIIPAQDTKGHHVRLYCRAMPQVGRLVADVHASKKFPFRTMGDLIRFCVVRQTALLASSAGIPSVVAQMDAQIALLRDEEYQLQFLDYFSSIKRVTDLYIDQNSAGEARRVVAQQRAALDNMPEGYWKTRYIAELMQKYGKLLDAKAVGAGAWDAELEDARA